MFPTVIKLRYSHPHVPRPYQLPWGNAGAWIAGVLTTGWMILGSWVAIFPGTIDEYIFGLHYSVPDNYGVSRARFEVFTLGTLGVVLAFAIVGYLLGAPVRRRQVDLPLTIGAEPATGD